MNMKRRTTEQERETFAKGSIVVNKQEQLFSISWLLWENFVQEIEETFCIQFGLNCRNRQRVKF